MWPWKRENAVKLVTGSVAIRQYAVLLTAPGINTLRKNFVQYNRTSMVDPTIVILSEEDFDRPMARVVFSDGACTGWYMFGPGRSRNNKAKWATAIAIETRAPDQNGVPRYAQLKIR